MRNEFMLAINQVCAERQLAKEVVMDAVEAALITAYKRNFGATGNILAKIDPETGAARVYAEKIVSEAVTDTNAEISLTEARVADPSVTLGDLVLVETTPRDFGRIAAQTAKQVILQRIREAERDALYSVYADREGEIVNGTVQSIDSQVVIVNLGKAEGTLPRSEQIPGERYRLNQRLRAYVVEVEKGTRGPRIILSRSHRNMLRRLLELEVPEIFNGSVEIKAIAREAGSRSKVAVAALRAGVDPVGSCVGMRGTRIQGIVNELNGEKIDVVEWNGDVGAFIANALSPAQVINVRLEEGPDAKTATVIVPDKQLSLAIGKEGQNARLAAKLTGWRIDIKSSSEAAAEVFAPARPQPAAEERDLLARAEAILSGHPVDATDAETEIEVVEPALSEPPIEMPVTASVSIEDAEEVVSTDELIEQEYAARELSDTLSEEGLEQAAVLIDAVEVEELGDTADIPEGEQYEEAFANADEMPAFEAIQYGEAQSEFEDAGALADVAYEPEWSEEEGEVETEGEADEDGKPKKKGKEWRKKHAIVYDEEAGKLVTKRKRKPSRSRGAWDEEE